MSNPIFTAAIAAAVGRKITCPKCGHQQVVGQLGAHGSYRCKKCRYAFPQKQPKLTAKRRH